MVDPQSVGLYIQTRRKGQGWTQVQLADQLRVSHQAVSNWEGGKALPDVALLPGIARLLGTSVDDLLNGGEPMKEYEQTVRVEDVQRGVDALRQLGGWIGRENTIYQGMVEGVNRRMNIDLEEMLGDDSLSECLVAEILIQHMHKGNRVDPAEVRSRLKYRRWTDIVLRYAHENGIE